MTFLSMTCTSIPRVRHVSDSIIRGIHALTLEYFVTEIVEPFFYRLAYVDLYGLAAARVDLWPEHSHGIAGLIEYQEDVRRGLRIRQSSKDRSKRTRVLHAPVVALAKRDRHLEDVHKKRSDTGNPRKN